MLLNCYSATSRRLYLSFEEARNPFVQDKWRSLNLPNPLLTQGCLRRVGKQGQKWWKVISFLWPCHTCMKQVCCLFCLCSIVFCTDDRCSIPAHTLVGSRQLVKILNRLLNCLAQPIRYKFQERDKRGLEQDYVPNGTTIISNDNVDFLHSYSQVFCGK